MGKTWGKNRKWAFGLVLAGMFLAKMLLLRGLTIYPLPSAACDDGLLERWAWNILGGDWLGPFSCYTFTKEAGFSVYLAALYRLRLPYIFATNLLYAAGCLALLYAVSHMVKGKKLLAAIYAVLLFCPILTAAETGQRVYRNGLGAALTVWVVGCVLNLYFEIGEVPVWRNLLWAAAAAGSLGFLWETKSDTVWLVPFVAAVLAVAAVRTARSRKGAAMLKRLALLALPLCGIVLSVKAADLINVHKYGASGVPYYDSALSLMLGIDFADATEKVSLSKEDFGRLCETSPALASVRGEVERQMERYDAWDTQPGDGNVEDGWIGWALATGFEKAGRYESCAEAGNFYRQVYEELSAAVDRGELALADKPFLASFHMATGRQRKELLGTVWEIWRYVAGHGELTSEVYEPKDEEIPGCREFGRLTRSEVSYGKIEGDYYLNGWVLYPGHKLSGLEVYVEDAEGNRAARVRFRESRDIGWQYRELENAGAGECRFDMKWDYGGAEDDPAFYLAAYEGGTLVERTEITRDGLAGGRKGAQIGSVDVYVTRKEQEEVRQGAARAAARCNAVSGIYRTLGGLLSWGGLAAYAAFTALAVWEWRKKQFGTVNPWLVSTGLGLSLLLLFFGIAVTHLENCPAVNYMYLSAAYPLLELISLLSAIQCAQCAGRLAREKKAAGRGEGA